MMFQGSYTTAQDESLDGAIQTLLAATDRLERRAAIQRVEDELLKMPQTEQPLVHQWVNGLYARQIFNPKGSLITTKIHREGNFSFMQKGALRCITETGDKVISAPNWFGTEPGTKRVLFALEDTTFITVHPNPENLRDVGQLENRIIAPDFSEFQEVV